MEISKEEGISSVYVLSPSLNHLKEMKQWKIEDIASLKSISSKKNRQIKSIEKNERGGSHNINQKKLTVFFRSFYLILTDFGEGEFLASEGDFVEAKENLRRRLSERL